MKFRLAFLKCRANVKFSVRTTSNLMRSGDVTSRIQLHVSVVSFW